MKKQEIKRKKERKQEKNSLVKSILKTIKKRFSVMHLLFLGILLSANAFAWFIYMDRVSSDIDVKVKSWNVSFRFNNQEMEDYINFVVDDIYPGMSPYSQSLAVTNDGETDANLSYEVVSISVMGDTHTTEGGEMTEEELVNYMNNSYPFHITITTSQSLISRNGGSAIFNINVNWPYESTTNGVSNDELDTYWGNRAYTYKQANPTLPCIKVRIKLSAIQVNETD